MCYLCQKSKNFLPDQNSVWSHLIRLQGFCTKSNFVSPVHIRTHKSPNDLACNIFSFSSRMRRKLITRHSLSFAYECHLKNCCRIVSLQTLQHRKRYVILHVLSMITVTFLTFICWTSCTWPVFELLFGYRLETRLSIPAASPAGSSYSAWTRIEN